MAYIIITSIKSYIIYPIYVFLDLIYRVGQRVWVKIKHVVYSGS